MSFTIHFAPWFNPFALGVLAGVVVTALTLGLAAAASMRSFNV